MLRAVVFDLDDTLTDHRGHEREVWKGIAADIMAAHPEVEHEVLTARHLASLEPMYVELLEGRLTEAEYQSARLADALQPWGIAPSEELLAAYLKHKARYATESWIGPLAHEALAAVRTAGLPIAVLTNGNVAWQRAKVERLGLDVDVVVTSEEAGAPKPSRVAFAAVEDALGLPGASLAMVGDNPVNDIGGALDAGWARAVLVRPVDGVVVPEGAEVAADALAAVELLGM